MPANTPFVSVLTATYNGQRFLPATLDSVLAQTFHDFEYIIVDDASTDDTSEVIAAYAARDPRIVPLRNAANLGPAGALNVGLAAARGVYVANLDHDDLAHADRLARQVAFLEKNPAIGVVGTNIRLIDETGKPPTGQPATMEYPMSPAVIEWELHFYSCVVHSTACMRRALVQSVGGYAAEYKYVSDYELWHRLVAHTRFANLPDYLATRRVSSNTVSQQHRHPQKLQAILLSYAALTRITGEALALPSVEYLYRHQVGARLDSTQAQQASVVLNRAGERYLARGTFSRAERRQIQEAWAARLLGLALNCGDPHFTARWPWLRQTFRLTPLWPFRPLIWRKLVRGRPRVSHQGRASWA